MAKSRKAAKGYNPEIRQDLSEAIKAEIIAFAHARYGYVIGTADGECALHMAGEWTPKLAEAICNGGDSDQVIADIIEDIAPQGYPRYCVIADRIDFTAKIVRLETIADLAKERANLKTA